MKQIFIVVALVQMVFMSQSSVIAQDSTAVWKEVKGKNYTISFPENWEVNKMGDVGVSLAAMAPLDRDKDPFRENFTMVVEPVEKQVDLKTYALASSNAALANVDDAVVSVSQLNPTKNGPNYEIIYSAKQEDMTLRFWQFYYISGGFAYTATMSGEYAYHTKYEDVFEKIAASLKFD